jgi:hypothetical protein
VANLISFVSIIKRLVSVVIAGYASLRRGHGKACMPTNEQAQFDVLRLLLGTSFPYEAVPCAFMCNNDICTKGFPNLPRACSSGSIVRGLPFCLVLQFGAFAQLIYLPDLNINAYHFEGWNINTQFVLHRRHITSPLQSPAG